ncbi:MAG: hypothetical protein U9Q78_04220 [Chloroflexota bacterium]|nr:hypothetical protein [Chloroflexota bacterium]
MSEKTTKIILIAIPIAGVIAMILIARWALSNPSPTLETLITVDVEMGVATLVGLFELGFVLHSAVNGVKDSINENTRRIIENNNENSRRIIEAIEGQRR